MLSKKTWQAGVRVLVHPVGILHSVGQQVLRQTEAKFNERCNMLSSRVGQKPVQAGVQLSDFIQMIFLPHE